MFVSFIDLFLRCDMSPICTFAKVPFLTIFNTSWKNTHYDVIKCLMLTIINVCFDLHIMMMILVNNCCRYFIVISQCQLQYEA